MKNVNHAYKGFLYSLIDWSLLGFSNLGNEMGKNSQSQNRKGSGLGPGPGGLGRWGLPGPGLFLPNKFSIRSKRFSSLSSLFSMFLILSNMFGFSIDIFFLKSWFYSFETRTWWQPW